MVRWGGGRGGNESPWRPIRRGCHPLGPQSSCTGGREKFLRAPSGFCGKRAMIIRWGGQGCGQRGRQLISMACASSHPTEVGQVARMHVLLDGASHGSLVGTRRGSITRRGASWVSDILIRSTLPSCMPMPRMEPPPPSPLVDPTRPRSVPHCAMGKIAIGPRGLTRHSKSSCRPRTTCTAASAPQSRMNLRGR
jgi:hypothetical protein